MDMNVALIHPHITKLFLRIFCKTGRFEDAYTQKMKGEDLS